MKTRICMIVCVIVGLVYAETGWSQVARRRLPSAEAFRTEFLKALRLPDHTTMTELVKQHRDMVRETVDTWLKSYIELSVESEAPESQHHLSAAHTLADMYRSVSQDSFLLKQVHMYSGWSRQDKALKYDADTLYREATMARARGDSAETTAKAQAAKTHYEQLRDCLGEVKALRMLGYALVVAPVISPEDLESIRHYYEEAARRAHECEDRLSEGRALIDLGDAYERQKGYEKAILNYEGGIKVLEGYPKGVQYPDNWEEIGRALHQLGDIYVEQGQFEKAHEAYKRALQDADKFGSARRKAEHLDYLGYFYRRLGDFEQSIKHHTRAIETALSIQDETARAKALARALNHRGLATMGSADMLLGMNTGGYGETIGLDAELGILAKSADVTSRQRATASYEGALVDERKALQFAEETHDLTRQGYALRALSAIAQHAGDIASEDTKRQDYYQKALMYSEQAYERARNPEWRGLALLHQGKSYAGLGNYKEARDAFEKALGMWQAIGDKAKEASTYRILGYYIYEQLNDKQQALEAYQKAFNLASQIGAADAASWTQYRMGRVFEALDKWDEALEAYAGAVDTIEEMRQTLKTEEYKLTFFATRLDAYEAMISLLAKKSRHTQNEGDATQAFHYVELAKARRLVELLLTARSSATQSPLPSELAARERELKEAVHEAYKQLVSLPAPPPAQREAKAQLKAAKQALHTFIETQLRQGPPVARVYAALRYPKPLSVTELQTTLLQEGEVVLEYFWAADGLQLFIIDRTHVHTLTLPVREPTLTTTLTRFLAPLRARPEEPAAGPEKPVTPAARAIQFCTQLHRWDLNLAATLYGDLVAPAVPYFPSPTTTLWIIPDGVLHHLPFEMLLTDPYTLPAQPESCASPKWRDGLKAYGAAPYLVQRYALVYAPSVSVVHFAAWPSAPRPLRPLKALLALAPFGGKGSHAHACLQQRAPTPWLLIPALHKALLAVWSRTRDAEATLRAIPATSLPCAPHEVQAISAGFKQPDVTLLFGKDATKAAFQRQAPDARYLHPATHGSFNDAYPMDSGLIFARGEVLRTQEIFNLKLQAELVTLSACETGLGALKRGEGLVGLTQAFLSAGTSSVVASLWRVNDASTALLMTALYQHLRTGTPKAAALQHAKRTAIDQYGHPYFWAPFVLSGAWQ